MASPVTRRRFLVAGATVAGCSVGTLLLLRAFHGHPEKPSALPPKPVDWRTLPPSALSETELDTLMAAVRALVEVKDTDHYAVAFQWRAMNLPGERGVYGAFVNAVDARARMFGGGGFVSVERATQQRIIEQLVFLSRGEQAALFYSQVVLLIFAKYLATDFWIDQGYEAWPGSPRGLVSHLSPAPGDDWSVTPNHAVR